MIPIQPLLVLLLLSFLVVYFRRLRSRVWDRIIVVGMFFAATIFVMHPPLANRLAALTGVGRGADLFFYVTIPALAFALLMLLSRLRDLEKRSSVLIRELALLRTDLKEEKQIR